MNRRDFLAESAAVGLAAFGAAVHADDKAAGLPIVDTHQHLWDLKKFKLPWIENGSHLDRSFVSSDYVKAVEGLNVVHSVYMEVDVEASQQQAEAECVLDICRRGDTPMVAAVISGRPASDGFANYIKPFKDVAFIKGVRQVLHGDGTKAGYCLQKEFIQGIQLLGELGKRFDICIRPGELSDAAKLIDACPGTRFILDHCGNADVRRKDQTQWKKDIAEVARRKNVVGKVSGIVVNAEPGKWGPDDLAPVVKHTLEAFGPDRVMFGGDWPVCTKAATYKQWVEALKAIVKDRKAEEQRKLFHDNAVRFYGLKKI
jgi:predicted TIM-barrel fold metal-dependent hydrolase